MNAQGNSQNLVWGNHSANMAARPYRQLKVDEIDQLLKQSRQDEALLRAVLDELNYRSTSKALALKRRVEGVLKGKPVAEARPEVVPPTPTPDTQRPTPSGPIVTAPSSSRAEATPEPPATDKGKASPDGVFGMDRCMALTSAPQRLRDLTRPPTGNDTLRTVLAEGHSLLDPDAVDQAIASGRFAIINLWRNIAAEPVATQPLALCDAVSVRPEHLVVFEIHYADRIGENYFAKHDDGHRWYFYPGLTRNEALLIKQWDSAGRLARSKGAQPDADAANGEPCTFSFHSAFEDPATPPDAPERWSIEVRCVALYG
jgi:hypothetical protein